MLGESKQNSETNILKVLKKLKVLSSKMLTLLSMVEIQTCFGGTYCLYLQG
jgi:hypothetical protein